jgi:hypothetical protein
MIGIDDIDPSQLTLMPRVPALINRMEIKGWPVRTMSRGESTLTEINLLMSDDPDARQISFFLSTLHPIDRARLRLGPFPPGAGSLKVMQNGREIPFTPIQSGDSGWAWIEFGGAKAKAYEFTLSY